MRRADRLFQIIQVLRRTRKPLTADAIAAELETSKRTIYRDIATLIGQRVPIRGEAGMGYILEKGFDLPPLMLTPDEIEAAVLGAQWVAGHADPVLARAAAGPDGQDRRHRAGTAAAVRAGAGQPRAARTGTGSPTASTWRGPARRSTRARRSRCAIATNTAATASARSGRSRSAITRRCGCWRPGASCARIFAASAPTAWSMPIISTRNIRNGATCCGRNGGRAWSGKPAEGTVMADGWPLHSALNAAWKADPPAAKAPARPAAPAAAIRRTGRASPSRTMRRSI